MIYAHASPEFDEFLKVNFVVFLIERFPYFLIRHFDKICFWGFLRCIYLKTIVFILQWELFRYSELDCWQTILKRFYKKEVEQIVMRYEEYRQALQREIERRQKQQKRLSSQALADLVDRESDV